MQPAVPALLSAWITHEIAAELVRRAAYALQGLARVVPIKGVLLGRTHYEPHEVRAMSDCDLVTVGGSTRDVVAALERASFGVRHWTNDPGVVEMTHRSVRGLQLDLHLRPLPIGYGAVTAQWLATDSTNDATLFGAPVLLVDDRRLFVHLVGNVLRSHIARAADHTAEDIARVLERSRHGAGEHAAMLRRARLAQSGFAALLWVRERRPSQALDQVLDALALDPADVSRATSRVALMRRWAPVTHPPLPARVLARCVSDATGDIVAGALAAGGGVVRARWLNHAMQRAVTS